MMVPMNSSSRLASVPGSSSPKMTQSSPTRTTFSKVTHESTRPFWASQAEMATPMWDSPVQALQMDQMSIAIDRIMNKQSTPAEALAEAQRVCQAELEGVLASQG